MLEPDSAREIIHLKPSCYPEIEKRNCSVISYLASYPGHVGGYKAISYYTYNREKFGSLAEPDSHTKSRRESGDTHILSWCCKSVGN